MLIKNVTFMQSLYKGMHRPSTGSAPALLPTAARVLQLLCDLLANPHGEHLNALISHPCQIRPGHKGRADDTDPSYLLPPPLCSPPPPLGGTTAAMMKC